MLTAIRRTLGALLGRKRPPQPPQTAWVSDRLLLFVGELSAGRNGDVRASVTAAGRRLEVEARSVTFECKQPGERARARRLVVVRLPAAELPRTDLDAVLLRAGRASAKLGPSDLTAEPDRLAGLVDAELSGLDPHTGERLLAFLRDVCAPDLEGPDAFALASSLRVLHQALHHRLPLRTITGDETLSVHVDEILAIDERHFWIKGWVRDPKRAAAELVALSPEGFGADVLEGAFRHPRRDVERLYGVSGMEAAEKHGLIDYFTLPGPSRLGAGWLAQVRTESGGGVELEAPAAVRDFDTVRQSILNDTTQEGPNNFELTAGHAHSALTRLQERLRQSIAVDRVIEHGRQSASPQVSVIVPLYQRIDFVHHQLVQFVRDSEMHAADLIYVLDSPELAESFHKEASELHEFYGLPFRVAILNRNGGFSNANNAAAALARGRLLLLFNSDVFPSEPGWLGRMAAFYDATPQIGALGPKLLYEDGSLQHAGMFFQREAESSLWGNQHYFKGLHPRFPAANIARPVPALTGACMMIERELYEQVGGLRDIYVQGGHEDSDLCLRLIEAGRQCWYLPAVELYHLENQSYPTVSDFRKLVTRYNTWLQTHLWGDSIEELMRADSTSREGRASLALAS